jgi:hypothetical protein
MSQEWIKCEVGLPKLPEGKAKWVSVYCLVVDKDWGIVIRPFSNLHNCWNMEDDDDYYTDAVGGKITHWMPLPDYPGEK